MGRIPTLAKRAAELVCVCPFFKMVEVLFFRFTFTFRLRFVYYLYPRQKKVK